jgi:hypothetical protein
MLDQLRCEDFESQLNSSFDMTAGDTATVVELIAVNRLPQHATTRQPFSLLFRGAGTTVWPQGIYRLSRTGLNQLEIFLVPIGRDESGVRYEAIFS